MDIPMSRKNICVLWSTLNEFRRKVKSCDVCLQVGSESFPCHSILLAAASEYFDVMFNRSSKERNVEQAKNIILNELNAMALKEILEFIYTGTVPITDTNVYDLLRASDFLQLRNPFVKDQCVEFIRINYLKVADEPISNVFEILSLAATIKDSLLIDAVCKHFYMYFIHFTQDKKFLTISINELRLILKKNPEDRCSENDIFCAIFRWMNYSREERNIYGAELIGKVDLRHITADCIPSILEEYERHLACYTLIENTTGGDDGEYDDKLLAACPSVSNESLHIFFRPEKEEPLFLEKVLISDDYCFMEGYRSQPRHLKYMRQIFMNSRLYRLGYDDQGKYWFDVMDSDGKVETSLPLPPSFSLNFTLNGAHDNIYLCGRHPNETFGTNHTSIQVYNWDTNDWSTLPPMLERTFNNCMTIDNDVLYVIGASLNEAHTKISAQAYDLRTGEWRVLPRTPYDPPYHYGDCCAFKGKIYVVDHHNQCELLVFDPIAEKWSTLALPDKTEFCEQASTPRLVSFKNMLWLLSDPFTINVYDDTLAKKWRTVNSFKYNCEDAFLLDVTVVYGNRAVHRRKFHRTETSPAVLSTDHNFNFIPWLNKLYERLKLNT